MHRDLMEISRVLMRVLKGGEVSPAELARMSFMAESELRAALLDAYVSLLEFAHHRDQRSRDAAADRAMRAQLEMCLERIADACDRALPRPGPSVSIH
jgi:hypothetical protein